MQLYQGVYIITILCKKTTMQEMFINVYICHPSLNPFIPPNSRDQTCLQTCTLASPRFLNQHLLTRDPRCLLPSAPGCRQPRACPLTRRRTLRNSFQTAKTGLRQKERATSRVRWLTFWGKDRSLGDVSFRRRHHHHHQALTGIFGAGRFGDSTKSGW